MRVCSIKWIRGASSSEPCGLRHSGLWKQTQECPQKCPSGQNCQNIPFLTRVHHGSHSCRGLRFDLRVAKQTSRKQLEAKQDLHAFRIETRENHMSGPTHTNTHTHTHRHTHTQAESWQCSPNPSKHHTLNNAIRPSLRSRQIPNPQTRSLPFRKPGCRPVPAGFRLSSLFTSV